MIPEDLEQYRFQRNLGLFLPPEVQLGPNFDAAQLQDLISTGRYPEAEALARQMQATMPERSRSAVSINHILARTLLSQRKFDEASVFTELAIELRTQLKCAFDGEGLLLHVLQADIMHKRGNDRGGSDHLTESIRLCEEHGLQQHLHIPVILKCIVLTELNEIDEVGRLLEHYLPLMNKLADVDYRDEIRRFWRILADGHRKSSHQIFRWILNSDVDEAVRSNYEFVSPNYVPQDWGCDALSHYLQLAEDNTKATFERNAEQFKVLLNIESRLRVTAGKAKEVVILAAEKRLGPDFSLEHIEPLDWLQQYLLMRAHVAFLAALRLGLSGQTAETHMVLRGTHEHAMYAFAIAEDETLKQVFFDKHKDQRSRKDFDNKFAIKHIGERMAKAIPDIASESSRLYDYLIEFGGHPNVKSLRTLASVEFSDKEMNLYVVGVNPVKLPSLLDTCIDVGVLILELFAYAMPSCCAAAPPSKIDPDRIAARAYERWCNRNYEHGHDVLDWCRAEQELRLVSV